MSAQAARQRYLADKVNTATPAQLVVMLYDRLGIDIERAASAQSAGDLAAASAALLHAQQIVTELRTSLDTSVWDGADDLAALYRYMLFELMGARKTPDPERLRGIAKIVSDLRSAWSEAAAQLTATVFAGMTAQSVPLPAGAWVA